MTISYIIRLAGRALAAIMMLIAALFGQGCTHQNGDIGNWFGTWRVDAILCDGQPVEEYPGIFYFAFQAGVIKVTHVGAYGYEYDNPCFYGRWEEKSDDIVVFNFDNSDENDEPNLYAPFPQLHFPSDGPFALSVVKESDKKYTLIYPDTESGKEYTYLLTKF